MSGFTREVRETKEVKQGRESLHAEIDGWDVILERESGFSGWRLMLCQMGADPIRLPLLDLHPKSTDQLRALAGVLPSLLVQTVKLLEAEGLTDLRGEHERTMDRIKEEFAAAREGRP